MGTYEDKTKALRKAMDGYTEQNVMIAFSGGADSSLLLKLACEYADAKHKKVYAVTFQTAFHPNRDMEIARQVAREIGAVHGIITIGEPAELGIENNPVNRCYLCKKELYTRVKKLAEELSIPTILEGTNADDLKEYRPGLQAIRELAILSPLAEAGMVKEDVRRMAGELGISVAKRPAAPCLATRFPYGDVLSISKMQMVEKGETYLRNLGLYNVRLRVHGDIARIEVDAADFSKVLVARKEIVNALKNIGYAYITLDIEGFRSGSMDVKYVSDIREIVEEAE